MSVTKMADLPLQLHVKTFFFQKQLHIMHKLKLKF